MIVLISPQHTPAQINNSEVTTTPVVAEVQTPEVPASEPVTTPVEEIVPEAAPVLSTCEAEIYKYDWNHQVALAVMRAESGLNTYALNNNPATGDYSVGCFQINLYGGNARNRPSEQELYNPEINVAFAYRLYSGNGKSFIGQWGVCRDKVACY